MRSPLTTPNMICRTRNVHAGQGVELFRRGGVQVDRAGGDARGPRGRRRSCDGATLWHDDLLPVSQWSITA